MIGPKLRAVVLLNLATLLWAVNITLGRAVKGWAGPWTLTGGRALVASTCFLALWLLRREYKEPRPTWREAGLLTLMGLFGVVAFQVLQYAGLRHTTAANAGLVNATNPIITLLLARALLGTPINLLQSLGAFLSLGGVALIILGVGNGATTGVNIGDLLVLAAVATWGGYTIVGKWLLEKRDTLWVAAWSTFLALPFALVPALIEMAAQPPKVTMAFLGALVYIGIGPGFIAFLAWNEGVRLIGPSGATVFINTLALYATILSAYLMKEPPSAAALGGGVLIIAGCALALVRQQKEQTT